MTNPAQGWSQVAGGYPNGNPQGQQQAPQFQQTQFVPQALPPGLQPMQQQLPPQMRDGGGSPLQYVQPRIAGMEPRQQQQQQQQPQQQFQQQPVQQQAFPQPMQQQVQQAVDPNTRLSGPGIPVELQGRTLAEAVHLYSGLRNTHLWAMQQAGQQAQQPVQQQSPQGGRGPVQDQQQGQQQQAPAFDWRNPQASIASSVREAIQQTIVPMLQPIAANNAMGQIQAARQQASNEIGAQTWAQIEAEVMNDLGGADAAALQNPRMWTTAAHAVLGRRFAQAQRGVQQPVIPQNFNQPGAYPTQQIGRMQNPAPNLNSFFTEQSQQGQQGPQGVQLTPVQRQAAQMMGIPFEQYAAMAAGIQFGGR